MNLHNHLSRTARTLRRQALLVLGGVAVLIATSPGIECGGIYPRWINEQNVDGHSPRVNASQPPGEWQAFDILFRAPRFDAGGRKIADARMVRSPSATCA